LLPIFVLQETVVELEYFEALPPPEASTTFKADDWIASVHAGHNGYG
jgi:hypothetical protein